MITVLAGGVGAARFLDGLARVVPAGDVTVIVNVGDDFDIYGVRVCPDSDIVTYTLAGIVDPERGFGIAGDTFRFVQGLRDYGIEAWFGLGDRDLATSNYRTQRLGEGVPLHQVAAEIARGNGVDLRIVPATDDPLRTRIRTAAGEWLEFQEYFVHRRNEPEVAAIEYAGASSARPSPGVVESLRDAELVIIAPSNPFLSIRPILAVPGVEAALRSSPAPVVAISPIVGGRALKGPADRIMRSLGYEASAAAVAATYGDLLDGYVFDSVDAPMELPIPAHATDTIMRDAEARARLARETLDFGLRLR